MFDFVDYFIGESVVSHANTKDMKMDLLSVAKEVTKLGIYIMKQGNCSMRLENVDICTWHHAKQSGLHKLFNVMFQA